MSSEMVVFLLGAHGKKCFQNKIILSCLLLKDAAKSIGACERKANPIQTPKRMNGA